MFYRKYSIYLAVFLLLGVVAFPLISDAVEDKRLVPCGYKGATRDAKTCTLSDLAKLADKIINFLLFSLAMPLAIVSILIGGILMITSRGDPGQLQRGKDVFYYSVIGFILAFGAWLIIEVIITTLVSDASSLSSWLSGKGLK